MVWWGRFLSSVCPSSVNLQPAAVPTPETVPAFAQGASAASRWDQQCQSVAFERCGVRGEQGKYIKVRSPRGRVKVDSSQGDRIALYKRPLILSIIKVSCRRVNRVNKIEFAAGRLPPSDGERPVRLQT